MSYTDYLRKTGEVENKIISPKKIKGNYYDRPLWERLAGPPPTKSQISEMLKESLNELSKLEQTPLLTRCTHCGMFQKTADWGNCGCDQKIASNNGRECGGTYLRC